jgi:hypothetical protein
MLITFLLLALGGSGLYAGCKTFIYTNLNPAMSMDVCLL